VACRGAARQHSRETAARARGQRPASLREREREHAKRRSSGEAELLQALSRLDDRLLRRLQREAELALRPVAVLREARVRVGLMAVFVALYVAVLALVTVQALAGESLVHPSGTTVAVGAALAAAALLAAGAVLTIRRRAGTGCRPTQSR
jgi:hypothetical protein